MLNKPRQVDHHLSEGGQIGAETFEQVFELRNHEYEQDDRNDDGDTQNRNRIEQRLLDFLL